MDANVRIRDARPADAASIRAAARASWHAAYDDLLDPAAIDETVDAWYDPSDLRESIAADRHALAVAEPVDDGQAETATDDHAQDDDFALVGFAHAADNAEAGRAELRRIYVREPHWGAGVGSALLAHVARPMREAGHDAVSAVVLTDNEVGLRFYRARGFEIVDEQTSTFGGETHAEAIVEASLDAVLDDR